MTGDARTFDTGVHQSIAVLPAPPAHWSYSTLKEIETCPRRYVLGHASYPDLWDDLGYPPLPHSAALFGDVVHASLERIIKDLVGAGCASSASPEAVSVLRDLGGYSAVAATALEARVAQLDGNPRIDKDRRERIQRQLEDRIPEARMQIQGFLQRVSLISNTASAEASSGHAGTGGRFGRSLGVGTHPEASLRANALRVNGRVDLLTVTNRQVDILDHKTGAEDPSHLDQLRFYALLWDQDEVANDSRTPLGELTASYPANDVMITAPDAAELQTLVEATKSRVAGADVRAMAQAPVAITGEHCRLCSVRSVCSKYWQDVTPDPETLRNGTWFDFDGIVGHQNGVKSWWMLDPSTRKTALLLRTTSPRQKLVPDQQLRLLGIRRDDDPEVDAVVATLTTNSEVFVVDAGGDY